eukprot:2665808-Amphidinium_carterae.1
METKTSPYPFFFILNFSPVQRPWKTEFSTLTSLTISLLPILSWGGEQGFEDLTFGSWTSTNSDVGILSNVVAERGHAERLTGGAWDVEISNWALWKAMRREC